MCDTIVATQAATKKDIVLFGKNSDRPPNEAQIVEYQSPREHDENSLLRCTHISIPQVEYTNGIFISRPHWIWGAEMGANDRGVVIGNEAVFSKEDVPDEGLLGMDLLRLGLERGNNAFEALNIITELLETHGQGGNCELGGFMKYQNSFIIADNSNAWVLETSRSRWIASRVERIATISNGYSIQTEWDFASSDLVDFALSQGWVEDKDSFSFASAYGNEMMEYITACTTRQSRTMEFLNERSGKITFHDIATILRSHPFGWSPWNQDDPPICQHSSHTRRDASTGSQISEIGKETFHWFTGSSNPCVSIYWPFTFNEPYVYDGWNIASEMYSEDSFWWRREKMIRELFRKNPSNDSVISKYVHDFQKEIHKTTYMQFDSNTLQRGVKQFEKFFIQNVNEIEPGETIDTDYLEYLEQLNKDANIHPN